MSFVALGGEGIRPTFFELIAADRLMPSLKAAITYSLSVREFKLCPDKSLIPNVQL